MIDLRADPANNYRQVDHRTIESIVYKNVRYVLKKGGSNLSDIDTRIPAGSPMWNASQLSIGDIFSGTSYYETVSMIGTKRDPAVLCYDKLNKNDPVEIDRSILNTNFDNANVFDKEEKISKTALATKLIETDSRAIQVCFTTQAN